MISLLSKIFIKNHGLFSDQKARRSYGTLCSAVGIFLNLVLFGIKLFAGLLSGSVAILADAVNNLSDAGSSLVTLLGFKIAAKKPDASHPFGHGRSEYIAGLIVSFFIITSTAVTSNVISPVKCSSIPSNSKIWLIGKFFLIVFISLKYIKFFIVFLFIYFHISIIIGKIIGVLFVFEYKNSLN